MRTVIYTSEKDAKIYEIRSAKDQSIFKKNELFQTVKTDDIKRLTKASKYKIVIKEVKSKTK